MNDRPLTWFLLTALILWALWLWRVKRLPVAAKPAANVTPTADLVPGPSAYGLDSMGRLLA